MSVGDHGVSRHCFKILNTKFKILNKQGVIFFKVLIFYLQLDNLKSYTEVFMNHRYRKVPS